MTKEFDARNAEKSRAVCEAMAERADTGKRVLTERERRILDMLPRFEDGEPVMIGDEVDGLGGEIIEVYIAEDAADIWNNYGNHMNLSLGERVNRPAPKVLDADGVEIKVGDTVYEPNGQSGIVTAVHPSTRSVDLRQDGCDAYAMDTKRLTHTRPDSWDLLEMEAESIRKSIALHLGDYSPSCYTRSGDSIQDRVLALVCRAKALAGAEAGR